MGGPVTRMGRVSSALLVCLALCACAAGGDKGKAMAGSEGSQRPVPVDALRDEAEGLVERQAKAAWQAWWSGKPWDPVATLAEHMHLLEPETVSRVRKEAERLALGDVRRRALELFGRFLLWEAVALETRPAVERYVRSRNAVAIRQADRTLLVTEAGQALAEEAQTDKRHQLWEDLLGVLKLSAPGFVAVLEATAASGARFGYDDGFAVVAALSRVDGGEAVRAATAVLERTREEHAAGLDRAARARGIDPDALAASDLSFVLRPDVFEEHLPASSALPLVGRTFRKLGLDLAEQEGVETLEDPLGAAGRPPAAFALKVPGDVRVGAAPRDGLLFFRDFFMQVGRAQQLAQTRPGPFETSYPLGYRGATNAAGRVVERLLADRGFLLANGMPNDQAVAISTHARLEQLHEVRKLAAAVLWHRDLADGQEAYAAWRVRSEQATGVALTEREAEALPDRIDGVFALDVLQVRLLAASVLAWLRRGHGERWWWEPEAGRALFGLWAEGQRLSATELLARVGVEGGLVGAVEPLVAAGREEG